MQSLSGQYALVTGASRGIGRTIALELAGAGATVFATARSMEQTESIPGTLGELRASAAGLPGTIVPVACDHGDPNAVSALFDRIRAEAGRLNILVNNMYPTSMVIDWPGPLVPGGRPFWEIPLDVWGTAMSLGIRSHCMATALAVPLLIESRGLIVNISSGGAEYYYASVPYGITKAATERLTRDAAFELKDVNVTVVSLWPGMVRTELSQGLMTDHPEAIVAYVKDARLARRRAWQGSGRDGHPPRHPLDDPNLSFELAEASTESTSFTARAVLALACDGARHAKTGKSLSVAGVAQDYGFTDTDGRTPDAFGYTDPGVWTLLDRKGWTIDAIP